MKDKDNFAQNWSYKRKKLWTKITEEMKKDKIFKRN